MCSASASVEISATEEQKQAERDIERERKERETASKTNCQRIRIKSLIAVRFAHYVHGMQDQCVPPPPLRVCNACE